MDKLIKYFDTVETSFRKLKFISILSATLGVAIALGSVALAGHYIISAEDHVYVIDKGSAVMAARSSEDKYRDLEAVDHIGRFHELMFNLSHQEESGQSPHDERQERVRLLDGHVGERILPEARVGQHLAGDSH